MRNKVEVCGYARSGNNRKGRIPDGNYIPTIRDFDLYYGFIRELVEYERKSLKVSVTDKYGSFGVMENMFCYFAVKERMVLVCGLRRH